MILADYPGHLVGCLLVALLVGVCCWAYRSTVLRPLGLRRWCLAPLTLVSLFLLIIIAWNPSAMRSVTEEQPCTLLAFFDTSKSMSIEDRLDRVIERFESALPDGKQTNAVIQRFGFDRSCYPVAHTNELQRWGDTSDLSGAWSVLENALTVTDQTTTDTQRSVSGVLLFSDGQFDFLDPMAYAPLVHEGVPFTIVGVGSEQSQPDLRVARLQAPPRVAVDSAYPVLVTLAGTDLGEQAVTVTLSRNGHAIDQQVVRFAADQSQVTLPFELSATTLGLDTLEVTAQGQKNEINSANNRKARVVQVVTNDKLRVLLYSQVANADLGKIRQALLRDEKVELDFRLDAVRNPALVRDNPQTTLRVAFPRSRGELNSFDVIFLGPVEIRQFSNDQAEALYNYVSQRGGAVIFLPGRESFGLHHLTQTPMAPLVPVQFQGSQTQQRPRHLELAQLSPEAEARDLMSWLDEVEAPPLTVASYERIHKKPAATTWLELDGTPLICVQRLGRGRTALINTSVLSLWYRENQDGGLLRQILAGLTSRVGAITSRESRIDLVAKEDPATGRVDMEALVRDIDYQPVDKATVLLDVAGTVYRMQGHGPGRYAVRLDQAPARSFLVTVKAETGGRFLGEKVSAIDLPERADEMTRTQSNKAFLKTLAQHTQATYMDLEDFDRKHLEGFAQSRTVERKIDLVSIWARWPLLSGLCAILILNWFLRRAWGMV